MSEDFEFQVMENHDCGNEDCWDPECPVFKKDLESANGYGEYLYDLKKEECDENN